MHYYQFNISDYRKDTIHLTHQEHYIYRGLIDMYYESEKPLTLDKRRLLRLLSCAYDQIDMLDNVLADFFIETQKGYTHPRIEAELEKIYQKSGKARESANKRWQKHANASKADANVMRTHSERNANGMLPNNLVTYKPKKKTATKRFIAPTLEQLKDYKKEKDLNLIPEQFIDFYESKGWLVGKNKMRDWKAAARGWSTREKKQSNGELKLPRDDEQLQSFAKQNNLPGAISGESYWQYRNRLNSEIEKRANL